MIGTVVMKPLNLPQLGTITAFSYGDGVGRIKLDNGTELKVGTAGLKGIVNFSGEERPLVGVRVKVEDVAPHPLGGFRAIKLSRSGKEVSFKRMSTPAEWETKLCEAGLSAAHAAKVRAAIRPAGQLSLKKGPVARAASKLGGRPDVPADFVWPTSGEQPLAFLGQLQLSDLPASVTADLALPRTGLVAFFIGTAQGSDDPIGRAIVLLGGSKKLAPAAVRDTPTFDARALAVKEIWTPPPVELVSSLIGGDETAERIYTAAFADHERASDGTARHRVGGHALPIQGTPENDDERLLLQIDSEVACGMSWGDAGRLYFLIRTSSGLDGLRCELQST